MSEISERIIQLYDLDTWGKSKELADRMGVSKITVNNYKNCETPPQKLIQQITKDFDGKEGRPLINWNWLFSGVEPMFKEVSETPLEPKPEKREDKLDKILSKVDLMEDYIKRLESKFKESEMRNRLMMDGLGFRLTNLEGGDLSVGKLNDGSLGVTVAKVYKPVA
ncbi:hypothetical protein [Flammeovirga sp. EKP202]|uniref:hypothetical protein n=1 Tax=Flammeovirga sp. EKP202 TaxID=2770592 RepID=UPI00165FECEC|nr:hypothetical protein [Flammeovirga sp. EKP202]MBD0403192.1 hypothetical protein [Flammeovirga sp. EKP202]